MEPSQDKPEEDIVIVCGICGDEEQWAGEHEH